MLGRNKPILAIDIGSSEIKALEVSDTSRGIMLTGFGRARIGSQNDTIMAINELMQQCRFKTKRCVTSVSGRSVIVRYVDMHQMSEEDLKQAIRFEADKYIPFEVDDVVMDTQILEDNVASSDQASMRVLLVAVRSALP